MKKIIVATLLIVGLVLVVACKSKPATIDEAFKSIYDRFRKDLILDGAEKTTVAAGDTLSAISRDKYDDGRYFPVIMLASSEVVLDPDKIEPGMELTIPDLQKNLDDPKSKKNIKNFLGEIAKLYDDRDRKTDADALRELADTL